MERDKEEKKFVDPKVDDFKKTLPTIENTRENRFKLRNQEGEIKSVRAKHALEFEKNHTTGFKSALQQNVDLYKKEIMDKFKPAQAFKANAF